ncbi:hypothetical protein SUDANB15_06672 [Streptomyces sp. enrichment culture]|uniref:ABC transporter permease n=1 Tax=Streptomyces sp. enrichment culture TaxID=1795815 RepID=UPI003F56319D
MRRLIAAEFQKMFTTRLWLWLLLISMWLTWVFVYIAIEYGDEAGNVQPALDTAAGQRTVLAASVMGAAPLIAVLAAIGMTGEYRHKTATSTFLSTPRRDRVIFAKMITYPLVGVVYGAVNFAVAAAIAVPWLSDKDIDVSLTGSGIPGAFLGVVLAVMLYAVLGVALGALIREQVATVVALLLYTLLIEGLLARLEPLSGVATYLPGVAERALAQVHQWDVDFLEPWQGGIVLALYAAALAAFGVFFTQRRDVT